MGENFYYNVGQNLQRIRKEKGYTTPGDIVKLYDLAFPGNTISNSTKGQNISKFENGKNASGKGKLDLATVATLAGVLHVSIDSLVYGTKEKPLTPLKSEIMQEKTTNEKGFPAETAEKPIEEYSIKDICKAFVELSNIANIDIHIDYKSNPDRLELAPIYRVNLTPKEKIQFCPSEIIEDNKKRVNSNGPKLALHFMDRRLSYIFDFLKKKKEIESLCRRALHENYNLYSAFDIKKLLDNVVDMSTSPAFSEKALKIDINKYMTEYEKHALYKTGHACFLDSPRDIGIAIEKYSSLENREKNSWQSHSRLVNAE